MRETLHRNRQFIPQEPTLKQSLFLAMPHREALYGGSAGGGKSSAGLIAAVQYAHEPRHAALVLRRTYADLSLPGAIMDRSLEWWRGKAHWNDNKKTWTFPSGATITFGYLQTEGDVYRYQGAEFQTIIFDELTQFTEQQYRYLFSRLRRAEGAAIPLRMRAMSNPGGIGHEWVRRRFLVDTTTRRRVFVPASLNDNPHVDAAAYRESLAELDPITRAQLLDGLWVTDTTLHPYDLRWWDAATTRYHPASPPLVVARWLSFDTAFKDNAAADYSACVVTELTADYRLLVRHVWRDRLQFPALVAQVARMAREWNRDGLLQAVVVEDRGSGTSVTQSMGEGVGVPIKAFMPTGSKTERARQASLWCERGCVLLPHPNQSVPWLTAFTDELAAFPDSDHDDQADAFAQAVIFADHLLRRGWRGRKAA